MSDGVFGAVAHGRSVMKDRLFFVNRFFEIFFSTCATRDKVFFVGLLKHRIVSRVFLSTGFLNFFSLSPVFLDDE